ncbi:MAG: competence/damage-inducible protein A [Alistipes inops]
MKAEIITIGDEILIGQIVDTNSAWIAARLNEAGFTVVRKLTVGDDRREIADAVEGAMRTADAVIVTGGLGPTKDDITKQTLAGIFGGEMVRDRETYERNGRILAARGIEYNELNREQATVPSSAEVLQNMHGTAPGMWFTRGGKAVVSLPGVPFEMKELMETEVMPRLAAHFRQSKVVHCHHLRTGRIGTRGNDSGMGGGSARLPSSGLPSQPFANQTAPLGLRYRRTPGGGGNRTAVRSARTADTGLLHRLR